MSEERTASFTVLKTEGSGEPLTQTRKQMIDSLKGMTPGRPILGAIGRDLSVEEPIPQKEELTEKEKAFKKELKAFIFKHLPVPELGSKFKPEEAKYILRKKLDNMTLGELKRFWGGKIPPEEEIPEEKLAELSRKWRDLSP